MRKSASLFDDASNKVIKNIKWNNENIVVKCRYRKNVDI